MEARLNEFIHPGNFADLVLQNWSIIDVRSEIEFNEGHLPGSINIPILNTQERVQVGTTYKKMGQDAAIKLGHELVCGKIKEDRINQWLAIIKKTPKTALTCFRGGLRSQIAQRWCGEAGQNVPRVHGGTKALRNFLINKIENKFLKSNVVVLSGPTGSGKSVLIRDLMNHKFSIDLEFAAKHRGSAFGALKEPQPSQILFENQIASDLIRMENKFPDSKVIYLEDESIMIGNCVVPKIIFNKLRASAVVFINEDLEARTDITFKEYILESDIGKGPPQDAHALFNHYESCTKKISKRLGGARTSEILKDIHESRCHFEMGRDLDINKIWIRKLLEWYYDPRYLKSLNERNVKYLFQGNRKEVFEYILNRSES